VKTIYQTLRTFIREQLHHKNSYTIDDMPHTFDETEGYDIELLADVNQGYSLTVKHEGELIAPTSSYKDYDEAYHQARMIIDKHRVQVMDAT
jgi:hypothetical protein